MYRCRCNGCGKHIRNEIGIRRQHCGPCWWQLSQQQRAAILGNA
jgi:hypothetical protein